MPYKHEIDVPSVLKVVRGYILPHRPDIVQNFPGDFKLAERLKSNPRPILAKLYVDSCLHCKNFKTPFERYAGYFENKVDFMNVDCKDPFAKNFCRLHNKKGSYPAMRLLVEDQVFNHDTDRTLNGIEKFIDKSLNVSTESIPDASSSPSESSSNHEDL